MENLEKNFSKKNEESGVITQESSRIEYSKEINDMEDIFEGVEPPKEEKKYTQEPPILQKKLESKRKESPSKEKKIKRVKKESATDDIKNTKESEKVRLEEIKKIIKKEFGGEVELPKTPENKLILVEKQLNEVRDIISELKENTRKNIAEFNVLFKSENIASNVMNKWWWEADKYDQLDEDIILLEREIMRAEGTKKDLEREIKNLKKEIKNNNGVELLKKDINQKENYLKDDTSKDKETDRGEFLGMENKKTELGTFKKDIVEEKSEKNEDEFYLVEKRMDEILKEQDELRLNKGLLTDVDYVNKEQNLQDEFEVIGKKMEKILKNAEVL